MSKPFKIAIVGRPNVGKSSLFNSLTGKRRSIVHEMPGVTRDTIEAQFSWKNKKALLMDTGGFFEGPEDSIEFSMRHQIKRAIEQADTILFVVDAQSGLHPMDKTVFQIIKKSGKPFIAVANKADNEETERNITEFHNLGLSELLGVSAAHRKGLKTLLDRIEENVPGSSEEKPEQRAFQVCLVGKPNVGKSSIVNAMLKEQRVIVSEVPGTTRDEVDISYTFQNEKFIFLDTSGLRKKKQVATPADQFGVSRTRDNIRRADCNLFIIDGGAPLTQQDKKIARLIFDSRKAVLLVVNKEDLLDRSAANSIKATIQEKMEFLGFAPIIFVSAKQGTHIEKLLSAIKKTKEKIMYKIDTPRLNAALKKLQEKHIPPLRSGKRLKIYYGVQVKSLPMEILLFINDEKTITESYITYIQKGLAKEFELKGIPLGFRYKPKKK